MSNIMSTSHERAVSFIGSKTVTISQKMKLMQLLDLIQPREAHHSNRESSDEVFHNLVRERIPECHIVGHPYNRLIGYYIPNLQCDTELPITTKKMSIMSMVNDCQIVIALVKGARHGGNPNDNRSPWYMIDKALEQGKEVCIIWSDGRFERHEAKK